MTPQPHAPAREGDPDLPLPPHGAAPPPTDDGNRRPCSCCRLPTAIATLNHFGGMCREGFERYCQRPQLGRSTLPDTPAQAEIRKAMHEHQPRARLGGVA